ncbi:hypothetical protein NLJ89_g5672 [Agrocybe chaxingu]|uniref:NmrA-like domain-containing protein n=1 Tax=Agrocybe chaxingu TaxID=84603 RepID=A0A9W8MVD7_9AGAR|nr:hypothetical protein NLJ89_g5672 [Agrocybe chaxingu]
MTGKLNIFFTGVTGYIGGSVLSRLLKHKDAASFHITALVRSTDKAKKLKTLGVDTIIGSYSDKDLTFLKEEASKADVVIAAVDCDNLPAAQAILDGLKLKYEASGKSPILIHTSGTGMLVDDARGLASEHIHYSDTETDKLNALPVTTPHRNVDIPILEADKAGYIKAYIVTPSTVFGRPEGPLIELEVQNGHSMQIPWLIKASIARKQGGHIGKGLNRWPAVHVEDNADLYLILFDASRANPDKVPRGYYFTENFDYSYLETSTVIAETLFELGIGTDPKPSGFTVEESEKYLGPLWFWLGTNCYAKADRGRVLGWNPKYGKEAYLADIKSEVKFYAQQQ